MHVLKAPIKIAKQFEIIAQTDNGRKMIRIDGFEYPSTSPNGECTVIFRILGKAELKPTILKSLRSNLPKAKIT